jgi:hypothetical protein
MGQNINSVHSLFWVLGVFKLLITLNSYDWLRVHSVLDSISMVHQSSSNVCDPLRLTGPQPNTCMIANFWATQIRIDDVQNVQQTMVIMNYFFEI